MCGILGIANFKDDLEISKQDFTKMLNSMQHRGPDDSEYVHKGTQMIQAPTRNK